MDNGVEDIGAKLVNLVAYIEALDPAPDFVLFTGDLVADGAIEQHYIDLVAALTDLTIPLYAVPGNHDQQTGEVFTNYDAYLDSQHWMIEIGGVSFIGFVTLNSAYGGEFHAKIAAGELSWLDTQLQAVTPGNKIILISHHGLGDLRNNGMAINQVEGGSDLVTLCNTYGVKAHLSGHVHASMFDAVYYYPDIFSITSSAFWGNPGASSPYDNGLFSICNIFSDRIEIDARDAVTLERIPAYGVPSYNLVRITL